MAAPVQPQEDRLHMAEQVQAIENLEQPPEAAPADSKPPETAPAASGVLATDKNGNLVGVDANSPLGIACLKQQWAIENAKKNARTSVTFYDRTIDLHKEQLKLALQIAGIQWNNPEHVQMATKISIAANGKAPIMDGLNILGLEFQKWVSAEFDKHKIPEAQKEIPL
jgi:hypothetical protein